MKVRYPKSTPLLKVLTPKVGHTYHLSWAKKRGMQWVLIRIEGETAHMQTPVTKKPLTAKINDLLHTRTRQTKILQGKCEQ